MEIGRGERLPLCDLSLSPCQLPSPPCASVRQPRILTTVMWSKSVFEVSHGLLDLHHPPTIQPPVPPPPRWSRRPRHWPCLPPPTSITENRVHPYKYTCVSKSPRTTTREIRRGNSSTGRATSCYYPPQSTGTRAQISETA